MLGRTLLRDGDSWHETDGTDIGVRTGHRSIRAANYRCVPGRRGDHIGGTARTGSCTPLRRASGL